MDYILLGNSKYFTKVCITPEEQTLGLMFQKEAEITSFPYIKAAVKKFWMKNTPAPLDIIFAYNNQIIEICHGRPYDLSLIGPDRKCNLVVEVPYGFCAKNQLKRGSFCKLQYSIATLAKEYQQIIKI